MAGIASLFHGRRRGGVLDGEERPISLNERDEQLISLGLPPFTEMTRKGNGWIVLTATAFAPVAALPGVTAALEIYNNSLGKDPLSIVVTDLFGFQVLSTAATQVYGIWAMVTTQKVIPTLTALDMMSRSGRNKMTPTAASPVVTAINTTVIANGWAPYGPGVGWGTAAATPGQSLHAPIDGKLIVPPGASLCVTIVGSVATASSFHCGAGFYLESITVPILS